MTDKITQEELRSYANVHTFLNIAILDFRKRLAEKVPIEAGPITITANDVGQRSPDDQLQEALSVCGVSDWGTSINWQDEGESSFGYVPRALKLLDAVLRVNINNRGCNTPVEEFISDLLCDYGWGVHQTPDVVEKGVDQFRDSFESMLADARRMVERYPELFKNEVEAEHAA